MVAVMHAVELIPHPGTPASIVRRMVACLARDNAGNLRIRYDCAADRTQLRLPPPATPGPADELWRHTCCELFIAGRTAAAYREFNFAPSGQWAVYDFAGYRERRPFPVAAAPQIVFQDNAAGWSLEACIPPSLLPVVELAAADLSLTLVAEGADGAIAYWALAHPREIPDFHDRAGFILPGSMIPGLDLQ